MIEISILIPAYNAASTLPRCLDSILRQPTSLDVEIVIVDDGSTDDTYAIAKAYEEKYPRVQAVTGPNKGAGAARNTALWLGSGRYFWFVDADDRIADDAFFHLERELKGATPDILIFYYKRYSNGKRNIAGMIERDQPVYASLPADKDFTLAEFPSLLRVQLYTWHQLFRRNFVLSRHLRFSHTPVANDIYFVFSAYMAAARIRLSRNSIYFYTNKFADRNHGRGASPCDTLTLISDERRLALLQVFSDCDALFASRSCEDDRVKNYWLSKIEHLSWSISVIREDLRPRLEVYARNFLATLPPELLREFWQNGLILKRPEIMGLLKPLLPEAFALSQEDFVASPAPFLSIIIPAWNVEKELRRCLESIFSQTAALSFECIVVDDGSTDGTCAVVEDFQKRFSQVRLLRQEHAGGGSARNKALAVVQGRYIWPVDADDAITENAFAEIRSMFEGTDGDIDMLIFSYKEYFTAQKRFGNPPERTQRVLFAKETCGHSINADEHPEIFSVTPYVWHCLLRRSFVKMHHFAWSEKIFLHDEFPFIFPLRWVAKKILTIDKQIYIHTIDDTRKMSDSPQTRHISDERRYMLTDGIVELKNTLEKIKISNLALLYLDIFIFDTINWVISLMDRPLQDPIATYAVTNLSACTSEHLCFLYKNLSHCGHVMEIIHDILQSRFRAKISANMERDEHAVPIVPLPKRLGFVAWELLNFDTSAARRLLVLSQVLRLQGHEVCIFHCGKGHSLTIPFADPDTTFVDLIAPSKEMVASLRTRILSYNPDVLCLFMETCELMWFPAALRGTGIPLIVSEQYGQAFFAAKPWVRSEYEACLEGVDLLHRPLLGATSPIPAEKMTVFPNLSLPDEEFLPGKGGEEAPRKRVIAVGPFTQDRRLGLLVQAFCMAAERHPDWDLYIYGEVFDRWAHEEPLRQANLKDRVVFAGLPAHDMYALAHLLCVPSAHEPLAPEQVLEAMRRGIPVLGFQGSGLEELVVNGENGILLAGETAAALAGGMHLYMQSDFLRHEYGAAGVTAANVHSLTAHEALARWNVCIANIAQRKGRTALDSPGKCLAEFLKRKHPYADRPKAVLAQLRAAALLQPQSAKSETKAFPRQLNRAQEYILRLASPVLKITMPPENYCKFRNDPSGFLRGVTSPLCVLTHKALELADGVRERETQLPYPPNRRQQYVLNIASPLFKLTMPPENYSRFRTAPMPFLAGVNSPLCRVIKKFLIFMT